MSFEEYVRDRGPGLLRLAYLLCGDRDRAQDLLQSAFVELYRHWERVEQADQLDAYVRRVLLNILLSWRRRRSWGERPTVSGTVPDLASGPHGQDGDPAPQIAERDAIWRLLRTLPPRSRAVLVLRFYEDADDATIASLLGVRPASVRATASRALASLRSHAGSPVTREVP